jgi:hypothetical protein
MHESVSATSPLRSTQRERHTALSNQHRQATAARQAHPSNNSPSAMLQQYAHLCQCLGRELAALLLLLQGVQVGQRVGLVLCIVCAAGRGNTQ